MDDIKLRFTDDIINQAKKQKPTDNALDMKGTSLFGGPSLIRR